MYEVKRIGSKGIAVSKLEDAVKLMRVSNWATHVFRVSDGVVMAVKAPLVPSRRVAEAA